jgi:hypothetical protein
MNRRRFLVALLAGTLSVPLTAKAQRTDKVYRIGFLSPNSSTATTPYSEAFRQGLRELGWIEGQNIVIEYRFADGKFVELPGLSWEDGTEQVTKKLEVFKEIAPTASRMAAVWNPTVPGLARYWEPFKTAATALGMGVSSVEYSSATDLDRAMTTIQRARPSGVFFWGDPLASVRRRDLCEFALKNRLPTLGPGGTYTEAGCLISYAPSGNSRGQCATFSHRFSDKMRHLLRGPGLFSVGVLR